MRPLARLAQNDECRCSGSEAQGGRGFWQRPVAMKKHRINADPARRIYRKIARIESDVRQKTFGSCDLIKEGETGDAKCLTLSNSRPVLLGSRGFSLALGTPRNRQSRVSGSRLRVRSL